MRQEIRWQQRFQNFKVALQQMSDGDCWMEMIKSRNQTSHTYNRPTAEDIIQKVVGSYLDQFEKLSQKLSSLLHT